MIDQTAKDQAASDEAALDRARIAKLSQEIMNHPILFRKLGDRVYALLEEDAFNQCDRAGHARRFYQ